MSLATAPPPAPELRVAKSAFRRLYFGQTAIDFWGRRWWGFGISIALIVISLLSLATRQLNLGIDFEGGVVLDVPAGELSVDDAEGVLTDAGVDATDADIQRRSSDSGDIIKVQIGDQPDEVREQLQQAFAEAAGVDANEVSVQSVSSTWGREITEKALRALVIFLVLVSIFISIRFEWRMALASIIAMIHDVVVSVGVYSLFGFEVTPETVIAFLTILGYSLYDTIVVFDRIKENERRLSPLGPADLLNVSMNQVLLRSLNTSIASVMPVLSLLVVGAGIMGVTTLREFALALLVGILTGAYSSLFIAAPILAILKGNRASARLNAAHLTGEDLRGLVVSGSLAGMVASPRAARRRAMTAATAGSATAAAPGDDADTGSSPAAAPRPSVGAPARPDVLLSHPPRPRKKKKR
jgi:preprotein translocase subunit SecF